MKTIILDDDPTGTQSATGALVLLQLDREALGRALAERDSVYVQTNSRALDEAAAVALVQRIRGLALDVAAELGDEVRFVLRGDSTLRGHVFAETAELLADDDVIVFAPAFPEGGRTTRGGVHYVRIDGVDVPAHETEYADDPVFPFRTAVMVDYVREASGRRAVSVPLESVRSGGLVQVILDAAPGTVIVPDAVDAADIAAIAAALDAAWAAGAGVVVRSASPLAAAIADVSSVGLLPSPLVADPRRVLLACGSHTHGATRQLALVEERWGDPTVLDTAAALADPVAEGHRAASVERERLAGAGFGYVTTARERSASHGTLAHGESVMTALTTAVADLLGDADVVVAKGGITSAEVASSGIGATSALVLGQVLPGVSVWQVTGRDGRDRLYVVVPGNVGGPETLIDVLRAVGAPETEVVR